MHTHTAQQVPQRAAPREEKGWSLGCHGAAVVPGLRDPLWVPTGPSCPGERAPSEPQKTSGCGGRRMNVQYVQPSCSVTKGGERGHPSQGASRIAGRGKAWSRDVKARRDTLRLSITKVLPGRAMKDAAEARLCRTCPQCSWWGWRSQCSFSSPIDPKLSDRPFLTLRLCNICLSASADVSQIQIVEVSVATCERFVSDFGKPGWGGM